MSEEPKEPASNRILDYVWKNDVFVPPQHKGGYDELPFTHDEYCQFVDGLRLGLDQVSLDVGSVDASGRSSCVSVVVGGFQERRGGFVLRRVAMGEHVDQLMTVEYHEEHHPRESMWIESRPSPGDAGTRRIGERLKELADVHADGVHEIREGLDQVASAIRKLTRVIEDQKETL